MRSRTRSALVRTSFTTTALVLAACGADPQVAAPPEATGPTISADDDGVDPIEACADVPEITTDVIGDTAASGNPDEAFMTAVVEYGQAHPDQFGGLWIDRDAFGTVVIAFTDDLDTRRAELAELVPAGTPYDVVQVVHAEERLVDALPGVYGALGEAGVPIDGAGVDVQRNRIFLDSSQPISDGDRQRLVEIVTTSNVGVDAICLNAPDASDLVDPVDPGADLDVIPDADTLTADGVLAECNGTTFPLAALADPTPIDAVDDGLRAVLDGWLANDEGASWPQTGWVLLYDDGETAQFAAVSDEGVSFVGAEMGANGWIWSGASGSGLCDVRTSLPDGLGLVEWELDPAFPVPDADATEIHVLATERACTSATPMGDRLLGPDVVETDAAVLVTFAAIPLTGDQDCPGNPSTPVTITLDASLGDRDLVDGMVVGRIDELLTD